MWFLSAYEVSRQILLSGQASTNEKSGKLTSTASSSCQIFEIAAPSKIAALAAEYIAIQQSPLYVDHWIISYLNASMRIACILLSV